MNNDYLEGAFAHFLRLFLELLKGSVVDTPTFVDQMARGGRFTGVHMTDHNDVDVNFFFRHFDSDWKNVFEIMSKLIIYLRENYSFLLPSYRKYRKYRK